MSVVVNLVLLRQFRLRTSFRTIVVWLRVCRRPDIGEKQSGVPSNLVSTVVLVVPMLVVGPLKQCRSVVLNLWVLVFRQSWPTQTPRTLRPEHPVLTVREQGILPIPCYNEDSWYLALHLVLDPYPTGLNLLFRYSSPDIRRATAELLPFLSGLWFLVTPTPTVSVTLCGLTFRREKNCPLLAVMIVPPRMGVTWLVDMAPKALFC